MNRNALYLSIALTLLCLQGAKTMYAQHMCGTMDRYSDNYLHETGLEYSQEQLEQLYKKKISRNELMRVNSGDPIIIPTVVHLVSWYEGGGISKERIIQQIEVINQAFTNTHESFTDTPGPFAALAGTYNIKLVLTPWQDNDGNWHEPITITEAPDEFKDGFDSDDKVKFTDSGGHDAVNPAEYLNIWVCRIKKEIEGYSSFPFDLPKTQGVVMGSRWIFDPSPSLVYGNPGMGIVHELGHFFNLRHIWGDEHCGDDLVDDTPQQESLSTYYFCPSFPYKVGECEQTSPHGRMFVNHMDYGQGECRTMYTRGQVERSYRLFQPDNIYEPFLTSGFLAQYNPNDKNSCDCPLVEAPHVTSADFNSVSLAWLPDPNNAKEYEVRYRNAIGGAWATFTHTANNSVKVTGLDRRQVYLFQIRAKCLTTGLYTQWRSLKAFTSIDTSSPCPHLKATFTVSPTSATFHITNYHNAKVETIVSIQNMDTEDQVVKKLIVDAADFTLTGLEPETNYRVIVYNICIDEDNPSGTIYNFKTQGCEAPDFTDHTITSLTSAQLTWSVAGGVTDYDVKVYPTATPAAVTSYTNITPPYTLTGLTPGTAYTWEVKANCPFGTSDWKVSTLYTYICNPPSALTVTHLSDTELEVNWLGSTATDLVAHTIYLKEVGRDALQTVNVDAGTNTHTFTGLRKGQEYEIRLEAKCSTGNSKSQDLSQVFFMGGCGPLAGTFDDGTPSTVKFYYGEVPVNATVDLRWRKASTSTWADELHDAAPWQSGFGTVFNLDAGETYDVEARLNCPNGITTGYVGFSYSLAACPVVTEIRIELDIDMPSPDEVFLDWEFGDGVPDQYQVLIIDQTLVDTLVNDVLEGSDFGDYILPVTNPTHTHKVEITSICNGVLGGALAQVFVPASLPSALPPAEEVLELSPNPVDNILVLAPHEDLNEGEATVQILNADGVLLKTFHFSQQAENYQVNVLGLGKGLYFVHYRQNDVVVTRKIIVN